MKAFLCFFVFYEKKFFCATDHHGVAGGSMNLTAPPTIDFVDLTTDEEEEEEEGGSAAAAPPRSRSPPSSPLPLCLCLAWRLGRRRGLRAPESSPTTP